MEKLGSRKQKKRLSDIPKVMPVNQ